MQKNTTVIMTTDFIDELLIKAFKYEKILKPLT